MSCISLDSIDPPADYPTEYDGPVYVGVEQDEPELVDADVDEDRCGCGHLSSVHAAVPDEMRAAMRAGLAAHPLAPAVPLDGDIAEIEWAATPDQPVSRNRGMRRPGGWMIYGDVEIADALVLSVRPLTAKRQDQAWDTFTLSPPPVVHPEPGDRAEREWRVVCCGSQFGTFDTMEAAEKRAEFLASGDPSGHRPEVVEWGPVAAAVAAVRADTADEWMAGRWWRVVAADGSLWCESSDEQENREAMRPGDRLERLYDTVQRHEWRPVAAAVRSASVAAPEPVWPDLHALLDTAVKFQDQRYGPFTPDVPGVRLALAVIADEVAEALDAWRGERKPPQDASARWARTGAEAMDVLACTFRLLRDIGVGTAPWLLESETK